MIGRWWSRRRVLVVSVIGVLVVVLVVPVVFGFVVWRRVDRVSVRLAGSSPGGTTYLFVGSDSRSGLVSPSDRASFGDVKQAPGAHADLVLLVRVPDGGGRPRVLALPRDLLVFVTRLGLGRLGPTLNDGPQALVDTVCRTLGIGVDHLMIVRFLSFASLVDAVGGVDVTVAAPERDTVLNFYSEVGTHHLDGRAALTYIRVRHLEVYRDGQWRSDPGAALGRSDRARDVLAQIGRDAPSIADPVAFARFAWRVSGAVTVDDSSGIGDLRGIDRALRGLGSARELRLPVDFRDGPVPLAKLRSSAVSVLQEFQPLPNRGPCAKPAVPYANGTIGHPAQASPPAVTSSRNP